MFTLYCDDSGTHNESPIAIAACLVARLDKWSDFLKKWCSASIEEDFGVFHRADFEGNYPPFDGAPWRDKKQKERVANRLIGIINETVEMGFAVSVNKRDYDKIIPQVVRDKFQLGKNHYTFAVRTCMGRVMGWRHANGYIQPMNYVFDRMSKGKGEIMAQFEVPIKYAQSGMKDFGAHKDCYSFGDKAYITPLQAADFCAWEAYTRAIEPDFMRDSYKALFRAENSVFKLVHHRESSLLNLMEWLRSENFSFGKLDV